MRWYTGWSLPTKSNKRHPQASIARSHIAIRGARLTRRHRWVAGIALMKGLLKCVKGLGRAWMVRLVGM
eukprot:5334714-Prymnesium_polylepis.1